MGWTTNEMRIAMNTAKTARKAVEIIKNFILDNSSTVCAKNFINALSIKKNVTGMSGSKYLKNCV